MKFINPFGIIYKTNYKGLRVLLSDFLINKIIQTNKEKDLGARKKKENDHWISSVIEKIFWCLEKL